MTHYQTEDVIQHADEKRDDDCDKEDDERVRYRRPARRPDDVGKLFAHMFQIDEW